MPVIVGGDGSPSFTNPATIQTLEAGFWRPLTDQEKQSGEVLLDRAFRKLLVQRPLLGQWVDGGLVDAQIVADVLCAMVGRVIANPEGKKSEGIDDYNYTRSDGRADGNLYAMPSELADITPGRRSRRSLRLVAYGDDLL